jgi:hypothetical protein
MNDEPSSSERQGEVIPDRGAANRVLIQLSSQTKVIVIGSALAVSAALAWGLSHASPRYVNLGGAGTTAAFGILDTWTGSIWMPRVRDGVMVAEEVKLGEPTTVY